MDIRTFTWNCMDISFLFQSIIGFLICCSFARERTLGISFSSCRAFDAILDVIQFIICSQIGHTGFINQYIHLVPPSLIYCLLVKLFYFGYIVRGGNMKKENLWIGYCVCLLEITIVLGIVLRQIVERPVLELSTDKVEIRQGETFDAMKYVEKIESKGGKLKLPEVDTTKTGEKVAVYKLHCGIHEITRMLYVEIKKQLSFIESYCGQIIEYLCGKGQNQERQSSPRLR